jgi:hypothetical protein
LLAAVRKLGPCLLEGVLLRHQRLRHVIEQARWPLLDVLLDPGFRLGIPRPGLLGRLAEPLE